MIQDKPKRSTSTSILTTHIGAEEWRRGTIFLRIPGRAMLAQIAIANSLPYPHLQIFPKRRILSFHGVAELRYDRTTVPGSSGRIAFKSEYLNDYLNMEWERLRI